MWNRTTGKQYDLCVNSDKDPYISDADRKTTSVQLPIVLRQAIEALIRDIRDEGEKTTLTELVQAALHGLVSENSDALAERVRAYRRARVSSIPRTYEKVVPFKRAGRPLGQ